MTTGWRCATCWITRERRWAWSPTARGGTAARVPTAAREKYTNLPWSHIVGVRNRLIHGYDTIDLVILWDIATLDLPPLIAQLEAILADESEPGS